MASAGMIIPAASTALIPGRARQTHPSASDKTAASVARTESASRLSWAVGRGENRGGRDPPPSKLIHRNAMLICAPLSGFRRDG